MYKQLATELQDPVYTSMTDAEAANSLNDEIIEKIVPIETITLSRYLMLAQHWISLKNSTTDNSLLIKDALATFDTLDLADPLVYNMLLNILDTMILDLPTFTETSKQQVIGLSKRLISKATTLSFPYLNEADIQYARSL